MRLIFCLLPILAVLGSGCGTIMRDLQFANVRTGLFPSHMDLQFGKGRTDARDLMDSQTYEAKVELNVVTVHYQDGMASLAKRVALAYQHASADVRERTGITWAFEPTFYLVRVNDLSGGFRLRIPLRGREMRLPMLVFRNELLPEWSAGIAHEITEASMLASLERREIILGDYCLWGGGLVNETRWFRDGVADYGGDLFNRRLFGERHQPPSQIYLQLSLAGESLLYWDNCVEKIGPQAGYNAARGLVQELINRFGEDVIARIFAEASQERYINGSTLRRAVKDVTGLDLREFLRGYGMVWLGMDVADSRGAVVVSRIYPGLPAEKWKLRPGDVILTVDGVPAQSAAWFVHNIAARRPRDRVQIEFRRADERLSYRMMAVSRTPQQAQVFLMH